MDNFSVNDLHDYQDRTRARPDGSFPFRGIILDRLAAELPISSIHHVLELGCNSGSHAQLFFEKYFTKQTKYLGLDFEAERIVKAKSRLSAFSERIDFQVLKANCILPAASASQDLFLTLYFLDLLRMDQIYMTCSEARRIVKPGGYWGLISMTHGSNPVTKSVSWVWEKLAQANPEMVGGFRPLELTHYISPEDWETMLDEKTISFGICSQALLLKRI